MSETSQQNARSPKTWLGMYSIIVQSDRKRQWERELVTSTAIRKSLSHCIHRTYHWFQSGRGRKKVGEKNKQCKFIMQIPFTCTMYDVQTPASTWRRICHAHHLLDNYDLTYLFCVRWQLNSIFKIVCVHNAHTHELTQDILSVSVCWLQIADTKNVKRNSSTIRRRWFINLIEWVLEWWMNVLLFALV